MSESQETTSIGVVDSIGVDAGALGSYLCSSISVSDYGGASFFTTAGLLYLTGTSSLLGVAGLDDLFGSSFLGVASLVGVLSLSSLRPFDTYG